MRVYGRNAVSFQRPRASCSETLSVLEACSEVCGLEVKNLLLDSRQVLLQRSPFFPIGDRTAKLLCRRPAHLNPLSMKQCRFEITATLHGRALMDPGGASSVISGRDSLESIDDGGWWSGSTRLDSKPLDATIGGAFTGTMRRSRLRSCRVRTLFVYDTVECHLNHGKL